MKTVLCTICGQQVSKRSTIALASGKRCCRTHQEALDFQASIEEKKLQVKLEAEASDGIFLLMAVGAAKSAMDIMCDYSDAYKAAIINKFAPLLRSKNKTHLLPKLEEGINAIKPITVAEAIAALVVFGELNKKTQP